MMVVIGASLIYSLAFSSLLIQCWEAKLIKPNKIILSIYFVMVLFHLPLIFMNTRYSMNDFDGPVALILANLIVVMSAATLSLLISYKANKYKLSESYRMLFETLLKIKK